MEPIERPENQEGNEIMIYLGNRLRYTGPLTNPRNELIEIANQLEKTFTPYILKNLTDTQLINFVKGISNNFVLIEKD